MNRIISVRSFFAILRLTALLPVFVAMTPQVSRAENNNTNGGEFSPEAAAIFNRRCTSCHTYGKGIKVGPDLKAVTDRRGRNWLVRFIRGSSSVIKSGDPTAALLFAQFKGQRMPDWSDLSEKQVNDILDYLALGGPDIKPLDERNAETATSRDIETGRELFYGESRFELGIQPCSTCHNAQNTGLRGGTLGPNLTNTYLEYQDEALTLFLRHPCFRWNVVNTEPGYLTPKESFVIKAFLRQTAMRNEPSTIPGVKTIRATRDGEAASGASSFIAPTGQKKGANH
jgi:cytochrome c2